MTWLTSGHTLAKFKMAQVARVGETADLAKLTSLDNDVLLNELHVRYDRDAIYVRLGKLPSKLNLI